MHYYNIFGAQTNCKQTRTHKTHHNLDLREATTFPLIVYFVPGHGTSTQMSFCPKTPKLESWNFQNWVSCNFGNPYLCVQTFDWDEVWSKVVTLIEIFPIVCGTPPAHNGIKVIPNFLWSKDKLAIWLPTLLLAITCVLRT